MKKGDEQLAVTPAAVEAAIGGNVANLLAALTPGGIEAQEALGQRQLCGFQDRLPVDGTIDQPKRKAQWEAAGFVFGEPIAHEGGRHVFVACKFPPGWKLVPDGHPMWSHVVDARGNRRAAVFFKAAFYDYKAHAGSLQPRYEARDTVHADGPAICGVYDNATRRFVHVVARWESASQFYDSDRYSPLRKAEAYLGEHYPDHQDPLAYWDREEGRER